jgi:predicted CopG family antitoxin
MPTNIQISNTVWRELNGRKQPGESFDDVLRRELGLPADSVLPRNLIAYLEQLDINDEERDAVEAMWRYVREHAPVSPQDIRDDVHPGHESGKDREWWWKKLSPLLDDAPRIHRASQRRYKFGG